MTRLATARTRPALRRKGLAVAAVSALLVLAGCGSDSGDGDASADDTSSASTSASASASTSASSSPSASASPSDDATDPAPDPVPSPIVNKAVKGAIRAGFPALVPSGIPDGWSVESARFTAKGGGSWEIRLTAPSGPVTLTQDTSALADHVSQAYGAGQGAGSVDVSGTGSWKAFTGADGAALAKSLAGTSAVLVGADQDTLVTLAEQLLTAEDGGNGSGDG
ncbi:DUF4245 family protein [Nocardioides anomalus]|uniref:DUF4245 family protein n=1 Tax=Nocardioides anomalus TaxID=2712223 RepID=A0A6G6WFR7_9ACTN|nr:DUF4245 family protein [Nocardioides anomalus]QIG44003.1 DUF4245 family protein [Nocardioides anomalus]